MRGGNDVRNLACLGNIRNRCQRFCRYLCKDSSMEKGGDNSILPTINVFGSYIRLCCTQRDKLEAFIGMF